MELRTLALFAALPLALAACQPPAAERYEERNDPPPPESFASEPQASPDAQGAVWAPSQTPLRLLYGIPGQQPFAAIACEMEGETPSLRVTRFVRADEGAQALMAMVGAALPELQSATDLRYLRERLNLTVGEQQAAQTFEGEIHKCVHSLWRTVDNLVHNIKHKHK